MLGTEGIHPAQGGYLVQPGPLYRHEARVLDVLFGAGQVYLFVRGVHVAAEDDGLAFLAQLFNVRQESVVEVQLVFKPLGALPAVGEIDVEQVKILVGQRYHAAFTVEAFLPEAF